MQNTAKCSVMYFPLVQCGSTGLPQVFWLLYVPPNSCLLQPWGKKMMINEVKMNQSGRSSNKKQTVELLVTLTGTSVCSSGVSNKSFIRCERSLSCRDACRIVIWSLVYRAWDFFFWASFKALTLTGEWKGVAFRMRKKTSSCSPPCFREI